MSTCPTCGTQYARNVRLCPRDGTVLEAEPQQDPRIGQVLDSKYRLDSRLSSGGMGTVYKATHLMLGKTVAVKLINPELVTSPEIVRRFQREARAASNLNHPNIAAAYDLGQTEDGTLYIAMEFVNGPSLKDVIRKTGPLDRQRIVTILRQVASALSLAHRHNIIHRDLKPHNIMLTTDDGGHEVAKLLDFGIAKSFDEAATQQLTATGFAIGTPQYMAPEQAAGKPVDGRSDLYSLGVVLYEMLIGEVPFNDTSTPAVLVKHMTEVPAQPSLRRPDLHISPTLEAVALKCLEKDPAMRFQTADEFSLALSRAADDTVVPAAAASAATTVIVPPAGASPSGAPGASLPTEILSTAPPAAAGLAASHTATTQIPGPAGQQTKTHLDPAAVTAASATPAQPAGQPSPVTSGGSDLPTSDLPVARRTDSAPAAAAGVAAAPQTTAPRQPTPPPMPAPAASRTPTQVPAAQPTHVTPPPVASVSPPPPASAAMASAVGSAPSESARSSRGSLAAGVVLLMLLVGGVGFAAYRMGYWTRPRQTSAPPSEHATIEAPVAGPAQSPALEPLQSAPSAASPSSAGPAGQRSSARDTTSAAPTPASGSTGRRTQADAGAARSTGPAGIASAASAGSKSAAPTPAASGPTKSVAPGYGAPAQAPPPPAASIPDNPSIYFRCIGAGEVCTALRAALIEALDQASLPNVRDAQRADITVEANVAVVDERVSQQFGTTFAVRTYSIEVSGEARRSSESIPMPAPATLSYDARVGQERLNERARLTADAIIEKVRAYAKKR